MQYSSYFRFAILVCLLTVLAQSGRAQFGVSAFYRLQGDSKAYNELSPSGHQNGYEVALDYWFRLPNVRIEFLPTISYAHHQGNAIVLGPADQSLQGGYNLRELGFQFKTNFYLFDLGTDCDCPTWGKQGPALHKGFFLQIAPGVNWTAINGEGLTSDNSAQITYNTNRLMPNLGVALGIDFGISNLVTLSPIAGFRYYFAGDSGWGEPLDSSDSAFHLGVDQSQRLSHIQLGLRLGIRLDERRY